MWQVQHEMDDEPTYVIDVDADPEGDDAIVIPVTIPWAQRLRIADKIVEALNAPEVDLVIDAEDHLQRMPDILA